MPAAALPIDPWVPEIVARARERRAVVVVAAPGAGKTTRVPPALALDGPAIVLQPRRVAARSIARRIAGERGWTLGREVGWHVRLERQFSPATTVLLATEGILTARLQQDPLLSGFRTVVFDEFHERSVHADLGLALARQAWLARDDLRIVVMSATLDGDAVSRYLGDCPIVEVPGVAHALEVRYAPDVPIGRCVREALEQTPGSVLCFLPGAPEIRRTAAALAGEIGAHAAIAELHGSLTSDEQDAVLAPAPGRRVIVATNIAETSLTVPGVTAVVDTGLHKVARYDPARAIDSLDVERITQDSADQRAGRAARLGPGRAWRLWPAADRLRPHREPEIDRIDLSGPVLEVLAWGGAPASFEWFEPPPAGSVSAALELLERLGATAAGRLTGIGRRMQQLPLHPRLARILIAAEGARQLALACAMLSERRFVPTAGSPVVTSSDLLSALDAPLPAHVTRVARDLERLFGGGRASIDEAGFRRALLAGYPDRVARRRQDGSPRLLLASGHGAVIGRESGVREAEFLVALDVTAGARGEGSEAIVRQASAVDRAWLEPTARTEEHDFDADRGVVRSVERESYGAIVLTERPRPVDPETATALLAEAFLARPLCAADEQLLRRMRFAGVDVDLPSLARTAAAGCRSLSEVTLDRAVDHQARQRIDRFAPERLTLPSGRETRLDYGGDGTVSASAKLQELFGLAETPRVGPSREPVLLHLLAPSGRPVQTTRDLRSFWERTYPEVRRELRGRYPKHPWPEDPWSATPTARTTRSSRPR